MRFARLHGVESAPSDERLRRPHGARMSAAVESAAGENVGTISGLERGIDWTGRVLGGERRSAAGAVLASARVAATVGKLSWVIWIASIAMGFIQSFTYAEIAGLFPNKAGGTSIYGAIAWVRYGKLVAPISVWCNWFAWSPVQATGSALAAGYILTGLFAPDSLVNTWQLTLLDLGVIKTGLTLRINAHLRAGRGDPARGEVHPGRRHPALGEHHEDPRHLGDDSADPDRRGADPHRRHRQGQFLPLGAARPRRRRPRDATAPGTWPASRCSRRACSSPPGRPTDSRPPCATPANSRIRRPTPSRRSSTRDCSASWSTRLVPFAFQGFLGLGSLVHPAVLDAAGQVTTPAVYGGMLAPDIYSGMGVAAVMARMVHAGAIIGAVVVVMLILALVLSLMTSMAGSSRTLYQASLDGWLPKYLAKVNAHGAPTNAMLTNLGFNLLLLLLSDTVFVIGAANVGYLIFNFLNLNAGLDPPHGPPAPGAAVARAHLDARRGHACCRSSTSPSWDSAPTSTATGTLLHRPAFRRADRSGVRLPALRSGQGRVPAGHGRRPGNGRRRAHARSARASGPTWCSPWALRWWPSRTTSRCTDMLVTGIKSKPVYAPLQRRHARPLSPDARRGSRRRRLCCACSARCKPRRRRRSAPPACCCVPANPGDRRPAAQPPSDSRRSGSQDAAALRRRPALLARIPNDARAIADGHAAVRRGARRASSGLP